MGAVTLARVLADVAAGLVTIDQHDYIAIPADIPVDMGETYRLYVVDALSGARAMRPVPDGKTGPVRLLLTTLGEIQLVHGNLNRYVSRKTYAALDRQVDAQAVTV